MVSTERGRRTESADELRVVLSLFQRCSYVEQTRFARELCERGFERRERLLLGGEIPMRVLLPYLGAALKLERMPEVLWLAELDGCDRGLLEKALELAPGNDRAWALLMEAHVWRKPLRCQAGRQPPAGAELRSPVPGRSVTPGLPVSWGCAHAC